MKEERSDEVVALLVDGLTIERLVFNGVLSVGEVDVRHAESKEGRDDGGGGISDEEDLHHVGLEWREKEKSAVRFFSGFKRGGEVEHT